MSKDWNHEVVIVTFEMSRRKGKGSGESWKVQQLTNFQVVTNLRGIPLVNADILQNIWMW